MISHKGVTFCAQSPVCATQSCPHWIDTSKEYDLPISWAYIEDTEHCPGFVRIKTDD